MTSPSADAGEDRPDREARLIAAARSGDLNAFNVLVELHQRAAYNLCLRMLGSQPAAEDATQEAFLSAFRAIGRFKGENFRPWLMRIAANACTDELRRRHRRPATSLDAPLLETDAPPDVPDPGAGPEALALRGEEQARIRAALLDLPADQRMAVILCDIQGFSYEEIAEVMRSATGTVKSRIARGREKLRQALARPAEPSSGGKRPYT